MPRSIGVKICPIKENMHVLNVEHYLRFILQIPYTNLVPEIVVFVIAE
jgi:hypothetical protein